MIRLMKRIRSDDMRVMTLLAERRERLEREQAAQRARQETEDDNDE
jgi:hypothetical protein